MKCGSEGPKPVNRLRKLAELNNTNNMLSFIDTFPVLVAFDNLDLLVNLQMALLRMPLTDIQVFTRLYIFQLEPAILVLLLIWVGE